MMQVVSCVNCGGTRIGFDTISVDVVLTKHVRPCGHCDRTKTDKQHIFFCHENCFQEFIVKVAKGEAEFKWKE